MLMGKGVAAATPTKKMKSMVLQEPVNVYLEALHYEP